MADNEFARLLDAEQRVIDEERKKLNDMLDNLRQQESRVKEQRDLLTKPTEAPPAYI